LQVLPRTSCLRIGLRERIKPFSKSQKQRSIVNIGRIQNDRAERIMSSEEFYLLATDMKNSIISMLFHMNSD